MPKFLPRILILIVLFAIQPVVSTEVIADEDTALVKKGRAKAQGCTRCHGRHGLQEAADRAGVQSVGLFTRQELAAFKSGIRSHPIMSAIAQTLSDEDIELIALWLESVR